MKQARPICSALFAISLALMAFALLGLARPAAADESAPFKGSYQGVDTTVPQLLPIVIATVQAAGSATHLGNFTFTEVATVNIATGLGSGVFVFTAANGDTVFGTITGHATFMPPNTLAIAETATITGGTGRFAGATGSFNVSRLKNTVTGATTCDFEGTISLPDL
jgi:hypothetical protein